MTRLLPGLAAAVQRNCDISDARYAGEYGLCTYLLKMREYYRWENELPFARALPKEAVGEWLKARELAWASVESDDFSPLPLAGGALDPFDVDAAGDELLPQGLVYGAGYGPWRKPLFFLGRLLRSEEREGVTVRISSCDYARELAAPPAMLQGRTVYVRLECVRRQLWEKIEEWRWRRAGDAMARALAAHGLAPGTGDDEALERMAERQLEIVILHELGEARAGELLGEAWPALVLGLESAADEAVARAVRDLLADCLVTLPALLESDDEAALHLYFAMFDAPRRQLFPAALEAYEALARRGDRAPLARAAEEGRERWLGAARAVLALSPPERAAALRACLPAPGRPAS